MAINKNFVIKNGVEVNTSLIVGDATLNKVGVGTTVPGYTLHVGGSRGGIGATDLTVTGIATVGTSGSTSAALSVVGVSSFQGDIHLLGSAGVSTISFDASLDKLNFADNARATFGADDDLQIFHDGSNSIIRETGTGNLVIEGTGETLASFIDDGAVELYYDNTKRLETTGFGVTIFDTLHSKQVNVSGASTFTGITTFNGADVFVDNNLFVGGVNINGGSGGALGIDLRTRNINASGIATITGQLGIGSIAAGAGLTVFGDVDITGLTTTNTLQVGNLGLSVTGVSTFSDDLAVGVSTLFADVSTGFVGVGTAVPGFPLEVRVSSVKRLQVDATGASVTGVVTGTSGGSFAQIKVGQSDINTITGEGGTLNLDAGDGVGGIVNVNSDVNLRLNHGLDVATGVSTFKNDLNVGITTFFVDKSTGRIGIGTNHPTAALEVGATLGTGIGVSIHENGNAGFTGIVTVGGKVSVGSGVTAFANGNLAVAGISTFNSNVLVGTGITIQPHGGVSIAGIVTVGGDLNVQGDITYDEIGGRNINITGFSTFGNDLNVGLTTFFVDVSNGGVGVGTDNPNPQTFGPQFKVFGSNPVLTIEDDGGGANAFGFVRQNNNTLEIVTGDNSDNKIQISKTSDTSSSWVGSNLTNVVTIDQGNIGVGIATATLRDSSKLDVDGDARFSGKVAVRDGGNAGVGVTIFDNGNIIASGIVTAGTALVAASAKVEDLTDNRVVLAGTDGELEDSANLTFDGAGLVVTGNANISGVSTLSNDLIVGVSTFFVDVSAGRVGIGTDNPRSKLDIQGSDEELRFYRDAGDRFGGLRYTGTVFKLRLPAADHFAIDDGSNNELFRVTSGGLVGIGTDNPAEELHLNFAEPTIRLEDANNNAYAQVNANNGNLRFDADQGNSFANSEIAFRIDGSNVLTITDAADIGVVLGGGATVGSSSGIVTFIGDGSQLTGVISGIDITEDAGLVGAAITNIKFTGSGISTVTTDTSVGIATISISGGGGGVSETDTSVSTTTATGVGSFAVATHRSAAIIAQIDQGGSYQVGRYLMIHDGTTATVIEESAIATGDMLGSFSADVNNSNAELKVTMNSSGIATVTTKIDTVTV